MPLLKVAKFPTPGSNSLLNSPGCGARKQIKRTENEINFIAHEGQVHRAYYIFSYEVLRSDKKC